jgi:RimJ/RimL family protein N-acetyltransferase
VTPVPELSRDGLLFRPWRDDDAAAVLELACDESARTWMAALRQVDDLDGARAWIEKRRQDGRMDWAVCDPATGALAARVGLHHFDDRSRGAEIGYVVAPAYRMQGVATRAVTTATLHGFESLGLARVSLRHATGNAGSCRVATRCGFVFEGVERSAWDHGDGVLHDVHRHARLATDPPGPADDAPAPLEVPVVSAEGLVLRPWRDDDAPVYLRGVTNPEAARWRPGRPPRTVADARRMIARLHRRAVEGTTVAWAVEEHGAVVGSVGLRGVNLVDHWVNAAYWVLPEARGRGVAARALAGATAYAFERLGLHRVQLQHAVANTASCRVADKAGFALEATQRESCLLAEGFVDEHQHVRVRQERR